MWAKIKRALRERYEKLGAEGDVAAESRRQVAKTAPSCPAAEESEEEPRASRWKGFLVVVRRVRSNNSDRASGSIGRDRPDTVVRSWSKRFSSGRHGRDRHHWSEQQHDDDAGIE